ncbi:MAG: thioredoxin family protein [Candidatus Fermentibacteria bacterium]|nr:thioredoxin family protein [Candidatus Fermentibacteria bacterium]
MRYLIPLTLALVLGACGTAEEAQAAEVTNDSATEGSSVETAWIHDDLPAALALAEETGKPVFIDLYADWCRPCVMLSEDYFSRDDYKEVLSQCILLQIDVDNNPQLAQRYRAQSIPTLILADASGNEIDRITGVMGSPEDFLPMISRFISQGL